jgi:cytochrome b subunit of formate dehydrogenase
VPTETQSAPAEVQQANTTSRYKWLGLSSFLFAVIQSVCTALVALSGLRLLIGAAAFASAFGVLGVADKLHIDAIRIPMMVLAFAGALLNLMALWQVRRLRARQASAWRQKTVDSRKLRSERWQFVLSVLTLLLLAVEFAFHRIIKG